MVDVVVLGCSYFRIQLSTVVTQRYAPSIVDYGNHDDVENDTDYCGEVNHANLGIAHQHLLGPT